MTKTNIRIISELFSNQKTRYTSDVSFCPRTFQSTFIRSTHKGFTQQYLIRFSKVLGFNIDDVPKHVAELVLYATFTYSEGRLDGIHCTPHMGAPLYTNQCKLKTFSQHVPWRSTSWLNTIVPPTGKSVESTPPLLQIQGEHKVFPWLQTFIRRKPLYVEYKLFF